MKDLPDNPSMQWVKKDAKKLFKAFKSNDQDAIDRIREYIVDLQNVKHSHCLYVIAKEYGYVSWDKLKTEITKRNETYNKGKE